MKNHIMMASELLEVLSNSIKLNGDLPIYLADQDRIGDSVDGAGLLSVEVLLGDEEYLPRILLTEGNELDWIDFSQPDD